MAGLAKGEFAQGVAAVFQAGAVVGGLDIGPPLAGAQLEAASMMRSIQAGGDAGAVRSAMESLASSISGR